MQAYSGGDEFFMNEQQLPLLLKDQSHHSDESAAIALAIRTPRSVFSWAPLCGSKVALRSSLYNERDPSIPIIT